MNVKAITLQSRLNGASKEYSVQLVQVDGGYVVNYQNGKIGGTMHPGTKTATPVTLEAATKIYEKLVKEKMNGSSHYTPVGEASEGVVANPNAGNFSGITPQLLNYANDDDIESLINDDDWIAQEKFDGENRLAHVNQDKIDGINRNGMIVALPKPTVSDILALSNQFTQALICNEIIGEDLHAFDILEVNGKDLRVERYDVRLKALYQALEGASGLIQAIETAYTTAEKRALFDRVKEENGEGVVFKRRDATFTPGKDHEDQFKVKFYDECTVIVEKLNDGVRSVSMLILDGGEEINVGNVTIPANKNIPEPGAIVEVKYLYVVNKGGSLFQPTYRGERNDILREECTVDQLKYKQAPKSRNKP